MSRLQHFGWFLSRGFGPHGWGHPYLDWNYRWERPDLYQQSARELEQAGLDLVIIEDALSIGFPETLDLRVREAYGGPKHDPFMLAPYLFAATQHLGIAPTVNAGAYPPYLAARQFATLQHLSAGRLGLNVVTDVGSARHMGLEPIPHDAAYDRATEWLGGVRDLWNSWDADALIQHRATKHFADGSKINAIQHRGEYFQFDGPLNALPFESDGDPVIVSPGGSPRGFAFAGQHSEIQLALASLDVQTVRDYRARVREQAGVFGRADDIKVLFVFKPVIVGSREEADRLVESSQHPTDEQLTQIAIGQSSDLETDITQFDLDSHLDPSIFGEHVSRGTIKGLLGKAESFEAETLRQILTRHAKLGRISDRSGFVGTADEVADFIDDFGTDADNDGFIFSGDLHPVTVHRYLDELVPILRRRGILRTEYGNGGLRANLRDF